MLYKAILGFTVSIVLDPLRIGKQCLKTVFVGLFLIIIIILLSFKLLQCFSHQCQIGHKIFSVYAWTPNGTSFSSSNRDRG